MMKRALLVMNDPMGEWLVGRQLQVHDGGVDVRTVRTRAEFDATALEALSWEVILFDLQFTELTPLEVLQRVHLMHPDTPCIAVTDGSGEVAASELVHAGYAGLVRKDQLERIPDALLRSQQIARDRRELRESAFESHRSQKRLQAIFEGITDAGIFTDVDRRIVLVNSAFARFFGYEIEEVQGRTTEFLFVNAVDYRRSGRQLFNVGGPTEGSRQELLFRRKDGSEFWSETLAVPILGDGGRLVGYLGLHRDISERKAQEQRLKQAAAVFQAAQEGIVVIDRQRKVLNVNPAFESFTGLTEAEVMGRDASFVFAPGNTGNLLQRIWLSMLNHGCWQGEVLVRGRNDTEVTHWLSVSSVLDEAGQPTQFVGMFSDISRLKQSEARLERLAHFDTLTNLPNRLLVTTRLQAAIDRSARRKKHVAVLYMDLDGFKTVNDSLGHPVGDELLVALAQRLDRRLRAQDTLGRFGGDEFLVVLDDLDDAEQAAGVARALLQLLDQPFTLASGHEVFVGASVGVSVYPDDAQNVHELIQHADAAMYHAKESGRNTVCYYTDALTRTANDRLVMETRMRRALERNEFFLNYQPLLGGNPPRPIGVEALVRWQPPGEAVISPTRFIPIAEETGLIVPLGQWVLREACRQNVRWLKAGMPPVFMAVNLSGRQFHLQDVAAQVAEILEETGLPPHLLELELTESVVMQQAEESIAHLNALKALGVRLAIDDFGTGYSSLAYLKRFPIDKLKIDRSFVDGLASDIDDQEIAATIIAMARGLRLHVLAEGVETREQLVFLLHHGCDQFQGYFFSEPQDADGCAAFLSAWSPTSTEDFGDEPPTVPTLEEALTTFADGPGRSG